MSGDYSATPRRVAGRPRARNQSCDRQLSVPRRRRPQLRGGLLDGREALSPPGFFTC